MDTVKKDRDKYLGGSEMPIILGLSPYKTRFELLLEKLGVKEELFEGNQYTEYGNTMEPKIREYLNEAIFKEDNYKEDCLILEKVRCNVDGVNSDSILEIKTASKPKVDNLVYLAQLLFYMHFYKKDKGILAVYENIDFDEEFTNERLIIKKYSYQELQDILNVDIDKLVANFWQDYESLKGYLDLGFDLDESLITNNKIQILSNQVVKLENQLTLMKDIENQMKKAKDDLFKAMLENNVKKWEMPNGTKVTRVDESTSTKKVLDEEKLKEVIDLDKYYIEKKTKRKGYVKITL